MFFGWHNKQFLKLSITYFFSNPTTFDCNFVTFCFHRYLSRKTGRGMVSPFVEVEICGADYDNAKFKTKTISDNGFNPVWDEFFDFTCKNPDLAMIR